jgi:hypothetical protein
LGSFRKISVFWAAPSRSRLGKDESCIRRLVCGHGFLEDFGNACKRMMTGGLAEFLEV